MRHHKLTPLEALQKQRADLHAKSKELTGSIENQVRYLHHNFGLLFRDGLVELAISKMPPQLQNFAGQILKREKAIDTSDLPIRKVVQVIVIGIMEIAPFFLKGKKGTFLSILMKQIVKWMS